MVVHATSHVVCGITGIELEAGVGIVIHAYNPSTLGGRERGLLESRSLRPAWSHKETFFSTDKKLTAFGACGPSYLGG